MSDDSKAADGASIPSPIEAGHWPQHLAAHVITPGPRPRVHGFDVEGDLARHYGFADLVLLALTGELPEDAVGRAFDIALTFLAPVAVTEAATHAAVLARICAGNASAVIATATIGLAEQARWTLAKHAELLTWLANDTTALPVSARSLGDEDRAAVVRLRAALGAHVTLAPALAEDLSREAAAIIALHACGLRNAEHIELALVLARLPCTFSEALAAKRAGLRSYPMDVPHFAYEEP